MLKIIIGVFILLLLTSLLSPQIKEFLNEKVQSIFKEEREKLKERELVGSVDVYSPRVEEIQKILKDAGFSPGPIDGRMGWQTRKAIREFQKTKSLSAHGKIDSKTYLELNREKEALATPKKEKIEEPLFLASEEKSKDTKSKEEILRIMGPQDKKAKEKLPKDRKKQIQIALQKAGFYKGKIDGKIGPQTRRAIREFQKTKGLKVDGVVGKRTWEKLSTYLTD